tara:strand:+ start:1259 stop:1843 length:585 start_codon:yes stop_codon:yes gene_type:complete
MKQVYSEYFQKSKVFLYPLLSIKKGIRYVPIETYIAWKDIYKSEECKFFCLYTAKDDDDYKKFEIDYLTNHKLFEEYYKLDNDVHLYVYDYSEYKWDLKMFKEGKYSKFSINTKDKISDFFGDIGTISEYIKSYINPEEYHDLYAEHLGVSLNTIEEVYELCSKPDIDKETLEINLPEIELFKNKSLSLDSKPK